MGSPLMKNLLSRIKRWQALVLTGVAIQATGLGFMLDEIL